MLPLMKFGEYMGTKSVYRQYRQTMPVFFVIMDMIVFMFTR